MAVEEGRSRAKCLPCFFVWVHSLCCCVGCVGGVPAFIVPIVRLVLVGFHEVLVLLVYQRLRSAGGFATLHWEE